MLRACFGLLSIAAFITVLYVHFIYEAMHPEYFIAYTGHESLRNVKLALRQMRGDIHVFGRRTHSRTRFRVTLWKTPFRTFSRSNYKNMLLMWKAHAVPIFKENADVLEYRKGNDTIAAMWPRTCALPPDKIENPLDWYREHEGHVEVLFL